MTLSGQIDVIKLDLTLQIMIRLLYFWGRVCLFSSSHTRSRSCERTSEGEWRADAIKINGKTQLTKMVISQHRKDLRGYNLQQ